MCESNMNYKENMIGNGIIEEPSFMEAGVGMAVSVGSDKNAMTNRIKTFRKVRLK